MFLFIATGSRSGYAKPCETCGAGQPSEARQPKAAGAPSLGVNFDYSDGVVSELCQKMGKLQVAGG